jgi:dsRNA-specific ribonuclease
VVLVQVNALYLRALLLDQHVILNEATPTVKDEYGMVRDDICADVLEAIIGAVFYAFGPKGPFMVYKLINEKITPKLLGA